MKRNRPVTPFKWRVRMNCVPLLKGIMSIAGAAEQSVNTVNYYFDGKTRENEEHRCVFQYTLEGSGVFEDSSGSYDVVPGQGFLWRVNDCSVRYYYPEKAAGKIWRFIFITFYNAEATVESITGKFGHIFSIPFESEAINRMRAYGKYNGMMLELSPGDSLKTASEFFSELIESGLTGGSGGSAVRLVRSAEKFIHEHLHEKFGVRDVSAALNISHEHFSRIFKSETGMTPLEYITKEKIKSSRELLKGTHMSCKEISALLGYENPSHFARAFRRTNNMTPNQFRQNGGLIS